MVIEYFYVFVLFQFLLIPVLIAWFIRHLQKKSRMSRHINVETGMLQKESGWGDAKINGVHLKNCVKVESYENGYLVRVLPIFFFGKLWLPKPEVIFGELIEKKFPFQSSRELVSNNDKVILLGKLAKNEL